MMTVLAVAILMVLPFIKGAEDCVIQAGVSNAFRLQPEDMRSCYYVSSEILTLPEAADFCEKQLGGHIAFVETATENTLLESLGISSLWLGAVEIDKKWYWKRWQDGFLKPIMFFHWDDEESEHTAAVFGMVHSKWSKVSDSGSYKALCEVDDGVNKGVSSLSARSSLSQESRFMSYRPDSLHCPPDTPAQPSASLCARHCESVDHCIVACYSAVSMSCCIVTSLADTALPAVNVAEYECYRAA